MADIVIRGLEMPNNVFDCPLNSFGICNLSQDETHCDCIGDSRPEWCPLVPLPEGHGRLIDADAFCRFVANNSRIDGIIAAGIISYVNSAPTIVPAEGGAEDDGNAS